MAKEIDMRVQEAQRVPNTKQDGYTEAHSKTHHN